MGREGTGSCELPSSLTLQIVSEEVNFMEFWKGILELPFLLQNHSVFKKNDAVWVGCKVAPRGDNHER